MHHARPVCARCSYWVEDHTATPATAGHCHRYPPAVYVNPQSKTISQKFPVTDRHHWCGEWCGDDSRLMEGIRQSISEGTQR